MTLLWERALGVEGSSAAPVSGEILIDMRSVSRTGDQPEQGQGLPEEGKIWSTQT